MYRAYSHTFSNTPTLEFHQRLRFHCPQHPPPRQSCHRLYRRAPPVSTPLWLGQCLHNSNSILLITIISRYTIIWYRVVTQTKQCTSYRISQPNIYSLVPSLLELINQYTYNNIIAMGDNITGRIG